MDIENQAHTALRMFMTPRRLPPRDWEAALLQQGTPRTFANGLVATLFGAGPGVLLVHGWEGQGMNLGQFVAPLVASGYQAIALDGPAHGASPGEMSHPLSFAQGILGVGQEVGPLAGVIAHSMGGAGTALAIQRGLAVQRVVLISSPSSITGVLQRFAHLTQLSASVADRFYQLVEEHVGLPADEVDIAHIGAGFSTPALIIHDTADREIPFADAQAIAATWPASSLYATKGLGHRRILTDPGVITAATGFLTRATQTAPASDHMASS